MDVPTLSLPDSDRVVLQRRTECRATEGQGRWAVHDWLVCASAKVLALGVDTSRATEETSTRKIHTPVAHVVKASHAYRSG